MGKVKYYILLSLIVSILAIIFSAQNSQIVEIKLFFWSIQTNQALLLVSLMAIGFVIGLLVLLSEIFKLKSRIKLLERELQSQTLSNEDQEYISNI